MKSSDRILIQGLEISAMIGVYEAERRTEQRILVDVELETNFSLASRTDRVDNTIDYAQVAEEIATIAREGKFQLVEALIEQISVHLQRTYPITALRLRVTKPDILPNAQVVGAEVYRVFEE